MAHIRLHQDVISGMWKFKNISKGELAKLAKEWLEKDPFRQNYIHGLYVRKCSSDQYGIGFFYRTTNESKDEYFYRITDQLKRSFGNDYVGYDIGPETFLIS
jgi:hypothetical protein